MKILHTNMLRGWGGQSNRILVETRGTLAAGHEVIIAAPYDCQLYQKATPLGAVCLPGYRMKPPAQIWYSLPDFRRLIRDLHTHQPDLIHLHGSQDSWLAVIAKRWCGGRLAGKPWPPMIRSKHNIFPWHQNTQNRWLYPKMDAFIAISEYCGQQVAEFPGLAEKPRKSIVSVPDLERFQNAVDTGLRSDLSEVLGPQTFLWGIAARLRPEKAIDVLLRAMAILKSQNRDTHLVIVGAGSEEAMLKSLAHDLGLTAKWVTFAGFRPDVEGVLKSLDGFVLPSRQEGLGTSALEALAVGLPVVGSNVGGIPESVIHEKTGLLFKSECPDSLALEMARVMDSPDLRARLGKGAREHIETNFTEAALVQKTLSFYEEVLEHHRSTPL